MITTPLRSNMENLASSQIIQVKGGKSLSDLPNETLLQIFSYVDLHRDERILGYIPDDPPPSPPDDYLIEDFRTNCHSLRDIALTCKRFAPLAQEALLAAPLLEAANPDSLCRLPCASLLILIKQLHARPELARHLKQLRICYYPFAHDSTRVAPPNSYLEQWRDVVMSLNVPDHWKKWWCRDFIEREEAEHLDKSRKLEQYFVRACVSVLLALLPQLERLCISDAYSFAHPDSATQPRPEYDFDTVPARPLTYVKLETPWAPSPGDLHQFPSLNTLDLSMRLRGKDSSTVYDSSEKFLTPSGWYQFDKIHHLRLDFEVRTVGIWQETQRACMFNVVQAFRNLRSLEYYAESSEGKNPYRSIQAFPNHQANIQNYPDESALSDDEDDFADEDWDRFLYNSRSQITDYQNLLDNIIHLRPHLEALQLPGGFWTLPGAFRKPLPKFDKFAQLKRLVVPQAAIISIEIPNMYSDILSGDFELSPLLALPPTLEYLRIFDVDAGFLESSWLAELFEEQRGSNQWPALSCVEILFGPTYSDLELKELLGRRSDHAFWVQVDRATFKVLVGRDMEGL